MSRQADPFEQSVVSPPAEPTGEPSPFDTGVIKTETKETLPPLGSQQKFVIKEGDEIKPYLEKLAPKPARGAAAGGTSSMVED